MGVDSPGRLLLAPDLFLECQEIMLQITDDPFEVKLKANYEVHVCVSPLSTPAVSKEAIRLVHAVAGNNSDLKVTPDKLKRLQRSVLVHGRIPLSFKCQ